MTDLSSFKNFKFMGYNPAENDWKFWLVVDPSKWLIPTFIVILLVAILVHVVAYSVTGVYRHHDAAPVPATPAAVAAPAPVPAAPAAVAAPAPAPAAPAPAN